MRSAAARQKALLPSRTDFHDLRKNWRHDLVAGITVGIVALPLALAFAITTGVSPAAGLATAIIAGLLAAYFGGSSLQVSGPTGAMTVVLVPLVAKYGAKALVPVGISAGILMILLAYLGVGNLINRTPWAVMEGFTLGIAIVIALQQIPLLLAVHKASGSQTLLVAWHTLQQAARHGFNYLSIGIVCATLLIKFATPNVLHHFKFKFFIPGSFAAIFIMTVALWPLNISRVGNLPRNIFHITANPFSLQGMGVTAFIFATFSVLFLAAIESLLSAKVADQLAHHLELPKLQPNRELFGQGIANIAALSFGGIPATGAIARTSVNFRAGAKSRFAAIVHALFLLSIVFVLAPVIAHVPTASLAAVLVGTSYRIINPKNLRELLQTTKSEQFVLIATALAVVATDLIKGALFGICLNWLLNRLNRIK